MLEVGAVVAGTLYPWFFLAVAMLALVIMNYILYHYYADPDESYFFAMLTVVMSLTVSVLCTLLIPVDIYIVSEGVITSESLHVTISQDHVRSAYLSLFSSLLFLAFCLVPLAYFYGEEVAGEFDKPADRKQGSRWCKAMRSTGFFVGFMFVMLTVGLSFRPGHRQSLDTLWESQDSAVLWVRDLLDIQHHGLNAISFAIACLTSVGVICWVFYTAYGMAAMPFDWLVGKQTAAEQRQDVEGSIAAIREKYRGIQAKYAVREDGSLDLSRMKAVDRKELNRLQREHKSLMQHNYKLQEIEQKAGAVIPKLLQVLVPFRWIIGMAMMSMSALVVFSLFLTLTDRLFHSPCGWECGYTIKERTIFNPADEIFKQLSRVFPIDFVVLAIFVLYIFCASVFGVVRLGIRMLCFNMYALQARKSMPQALLVLCNVMAYILLALCMALLTIAPNYTSFGSQTSNAIEGGKQSQCSMERRESTSTCQVSVISAFFTRIAFAMPIFSLAYFYANWAFIAVFLGVFARCLLSHQRAPYLDQVGECEEEELGLLTFS